MSVSTASARTLVDEFVRAGLRLAVVAPGSRSAPLALALADDEHIELHVLLDERSAAFFALGAAKASGRPALVVCTSGTAAAHFHPAVLEADHSRVPLIVCTADRPAELRDTGAPQTTDQVRLYGSAVRFFADLPADADPAARAAWRPIAARVWAEAAGPPAGPVHLNVAFREPLLPGAGRPASEQMEPGRDGGRPWVVSHRPASEELPAEVADGLVARIGAAERGLVVAGWGTGGRAGGAGRSAGAAEVAETLRWPLLADAISGQRKAGTITTYEALLRVPGFAERHRPDLVIRFGGPLTSKAGMAWLDASVPQILVDPDSAWLDPQRAAAVRVPGLPDLAAVAAEGDSGWYDAWAGADKAARAALDAVLDSDDEPFEGRVARDVAAVCAASDRSPALLVASSMPVRDLEAFAGRVPAEVYANRGVNGIDGLVSTVLGVAAAGDGGLEDDGGGAGRERVTAAGDGGLEYDGGGAGRERVAAAGDGGLEYDGGGAGRERVAAAGDGGLEYDGGGAGRYGSADELRRRPAVGLLGDLAFLHDAGGLLGAAERGLDAVLVVVDNGGGGIFSFLPQAELAPERFELLFGTPPGVDVAAVATAYGLPVERAERAGEVGPALDRALAAGGVRVIVVPTGDRTANVDRHRRAWATVAEALAKTNG